MGGRHSRWRSGATKPRTARWPARGAGQLPPQSAEIQISSLTNLKMYREYLNEKSIVNPLIRNIGLPFSIRG